jgi:lipid-binding SYLF domain-containing protein
MFFYPGRYLCYFLLFIITGCATTGTTVSDGQNNIDRMSNIVLTQLYLLKPDVKMQIEDSPGYAVFSSANVNILLISFGGGYGVVNNNYTGKRTYMKMGEAGVGPGLGIKDFRAVFVFHSKAVLESFIEDGWSLGAQVDAAIKYNDLGGATGGSVNVGDITVYEITESGLTLQATLKATKYWKDEYLNRPGLKLSTYEN